MQREGAIQQESISMRCRVYYLPWPCLLPNNTTASKSPVGTPPFSLWLISCCHNISSKIQSFYCHLFLFLGSISLSLCVQFLVQRKRDTTPTPHHEPPENELWSTGEKEAFRLMTGEAVGDQWSGCRQRAIPTTKPHPVQPVY
jgi:hypothetical protein